MWHAVEMQEFLDDIKAIQEEFKEIAAVLDERRIRLWGAARARTYNRQHGRGGVMVVHKATGISRPRIYAGVKELENAPLLAPARVRQPGGGRKKR